MANTGFKNKEEQRRAERKRERRWGAASTCLRLGLVGGAGRFPWRRGVRVKRDA